MNQQGGYPQMEQMPPINNAPQKTSSGIIISFIIIVVLIIIGWVLLARNGAQTTDMLGGTENELVSEELRTEIPVDDSIADIEADLEAINFEDLAQ